MCVYVYVYVHVYNIMYFKCLCTYIIHMCVYVHLCIMFMYVYCVHVFVCTELQLKSYHVPVKLFKKWRDLLTQYTTASSDVCKTGK